MPGKAKYLAVAFTDLNGNHKFDANKGDLLIAGILDTNRSKTIDAGDTIDWGTYPLTQDGGERGTFQHDDSLITAVSTATSTNVAVITAEGVVAFTSGTLDAGLPTAQTSENFFTLSFSAGTESSLRDFITSGFTDEIQVNAGVAGPGLPDTSASESAFHVGNDGFLDVFIA